MWAAIKRFLGRLWDAFSGEPYPSESAPAQTPDGKGPVPPAEMPVEPPTLTPEPVDLGDRTPKLPPRTRVRPDRPTTPIYEPPAFTQPTLGGQLLDAPRPVHYEMPATLARVRIINEPEVYGAAQWWRNGDHPEDKAKNDLGEVVREGEVVRYFRRPDVGGRVKCSKCGNRMHEHGWLDFPPNGQTVCPGDYILVNNAGRRWRVAPREFQTGFEPH